MGVRYEIIYRTRIGEYRSSGGVALVEAIADSASESANRLTRALFPGSDTTHITKAERSNDGVWRIYLDVSDRGDHQRTNTVEGFTFRPAKQ